MGEYVAIRSLKPGQKDVNVVFIVLDINRPTKTKEGHEVRTVKVADRSASINLSMWDELGKQVQSGDIIRMTKGYTNVWKNCLTLNGSKASEFMKIGEFCFVFAEMPFMSEPSPELATAANNSQAGNTGSKGGNPGNSRQGNNNSDRGPRYNNGGGGPAAPPSQQVPGAGPPGAPPTPAGPSKWGQTPSNPGRAGSGPSGPPSGPGAKDRLR